MMELVERAIPVIQHLPEARDRAEPASQDRAAGPRGSLSEGLPEPTDGARSALADDQEARDFQAELANVRAALERLRVQHAQLTSGVVLQQYQKRLTPDVEDSRPANRALSVQG